MLINLNWYSNDNVPHGNKIDSKRMALAKHFRLMTFYFQFFDTVMRQYNDANIPADHPNYPVRLH